MRVRANNASGGGGNIVGCSDVVASLIPSDDKDAIYYSNSRTDNYSSYKTMFTIVTGSVPVSIEVECWFLMNGTWQSTGGTAYARQYVIDGNATSIPINPNKETITIPANKTCEIQQTTGGNNYANRIQFLFK